MESTERLVTTMCFKIPRLITWLLFTLFCASNIANAQVSRVEASIDKNPVMLDESFTLTVTADGDVERDAFDSSSLLSSFVVGRTSVSSQTRMVNFKTSRSTTWTTILFPRSTGEFVIPSFQIEGQFSQPITVSVIPVSSGNNSEGRDVFVTTELDKDTVYLHQQVKYSVKLYLAREIERGSLQAPVLDNAEIQQIGKDAEYSEILNGKRYRIIERDFIIIPQRSGEFTINGPIFQGDVITNSRQSFGFFNRTETVSRVGPVQKLSVLPIPNSVSGAFLPSEFVDLHQEWSTEPDEWRVGEPVTRTITLTAVGLTESLLPDINDEYPPDIKTYPDQASTATAENDQSLVAQRTESIALIPSRSGQYVLPPVKVEWFNVATENIEVAELPARSITVLPAINSANSNQQSSPSTGGLNANEQVSNSNVSERTVSPSQLADISKYEQQIGELEVKVTRWQWATISLALLLMVVVVVTALARFKKQPSKTGIRQARQNPEKHCWKQLQDDLKLGDAVKIKSSLIQWIRVITQRDVIDLSATLSALQQQHIMNEVNALFASQYGDSNSEWQAETLRKHLLLLRSQLLESNNKPQQLAPLYPS